MKGYITGISNINVSQKKNLYFDIELMFNRTRVLPIRVMEDGNNYRFMKKCMENKSPLQFKGLCHRPGITFFNIWSVCKIYPKGLDFTFEDATDSKVKDIIDNPPNGLVQITGNCEWLSTVQIVCVGGSMKKVRDAKFSDETGCLVMEIGNNLIEEINENTVYKITSVATFIYKKKPKLTTTITSTVMVKLSD
jgi:hypothetical protein